MAARFRRHRPESLAVSSVAVAELRVGAELSRDPTEGNRRIDVILQDVTEVPFGSRAARTFGKLKAELSRRKVSARVGDMDALVASQAIAEGQVVATLNRRDFARLPGARWEDWSTGESGVAT